MKKKFSILLFIALQQAIFSQTFSNTDLIKLKQTNQNQVSTSIQDQNLNFSNDFNPNIQIALSNPDYMVTPGDIYSLNYAVGTNPVSYKILVDTSYKIRVSNLAVLDATNKTYMQLKKQVEEIVSKNYPLSGVQFILTSPASFKITVTGCVSYSSEQKAWAECLLCGYCSCACADAAAADGGRYQEHDGYLPRKVHLLCHCCNRIGSDLGLYRYPFPGSRTVFCARRLRHGHVSQATGNERKYYGFHEDRRTDRAAAHLAGV